MGRINVTFTIFADLRDPAMRGHDHLEVEDGSAYLWRARASSRRGVVGVW